MKMLAVIAFSVVMLSVAFVGLASASPTPFASDANYMSLPGYTRFLNFQQTGHWTPI